MSLTLESMLSWHYLTDIVRAVKPGVPDVFPEQFYSLTKEVLGDRVEYVQLYGTRKLAQRVPYMAPTKAIPKTVLNYRQVELMQFANRMVFEQEFLRWLRKFDAWEEQRMRCVDLLNEQAEQFAMRFENTRRTSIGLFLATGKNWFDVNYNFLPTSSGAVLTCDQGIPAANTGTITDPYSAGGVVVNASWALPTTDLVSQVNNLKTVAIKASGYEVARAFYGRNVAGYIARNEVAKSYFPYDLPLAQQITKEGKIPSGFLGLEWTPVQNAFFDTEAGVSTEYFPADQVTFFPDITRATYTLFEGSKLVPEYFTQAATPTEILRNSAEVHGFGRYSYWDLQSGPTVLVDEAFDTFMPVFKIPNGVFLMDTTP